MTDSAQTDDRDAIERLMTRWMEATAAGDLQILLSLMTDDAVFMVPGQEPFGKSAFAEASAQVHKRSATPA